MSTIGKPCSLPAQNVAPHGVRVGMRQAHVIVPKGSAEQNSFRPGPDIARCSRRRALLQMLRCLLTHRRAAREKQKPAHQQGADMRNRFTPFLAVAAGTVLLAGAITPAAAGPAECETIGKAFQAIAAVPAYRQVVDMTTPPMKMEAIVIGETIYMSVAGSWNKVRLKPGGRKGMLEEIMKMTSVSDCKEVRADTLPSGNAKVFEYMMTPPKGMPGVSDKPAKYTVWIGVSDGLVHRMLAESMTVDLSFEKQVPPIP
ncbi:hypothetical protein [Rhabdaerophilum calidifontis]|uniref:hypothetical protein n=1 Tax=Rhabdaerophilum calidifontis TaxID=2604328 RepID=UPI00123B0B0F|nr:hypothetical protein [Rhabdaerophilum calidifontis]